MQRVNAGRGANFRPCCSCCSGRSGRSGPGPGRTGHSVRAGRTGRAVQQARVIAQVAQVRGGAAVESELFIAMQFFVQIRSGAVVAQLVAQIVLVIHGVQVVVLFICGGAAAATRPNLALEHVAQDLSELVQVVAQDQDDGAATMSSISTGLARWKFRLIFARRRPRSALPCCQDTQ